MPPLFLQFEKHFDDLQNYECKKPVEKFDPGLLIEEDGTAFNGADEDMLQDAVSMGADRGMEKDQRSIRKFQGRTLSQNGIFNQPTFPTFPPATI